MAYMAGFPEPCRSGHGNAVFSFAGGIVLSLVCPGWGQFARWVASYGQDSRFSSRTVAVLLAVVIGAQSCVTVTA